MAATPGTSLTLISSGLADARQNAPRGNPDINQFVKVLKKTTRWAAQWYRVDFDGSPEFGTRASVTLPRIGEFVSGITVVVRMPDIYTTQLRAIRAAGGTSLDDCGDFLGPLYGWTNSLGHALIQQIELEIGGAIVETLDSRLLEILDELYEPLESVIAKNTMIKRAPSGFNARTWLSEDMTTVYVPIPFWFSRPGKYSHALPIDALSADKIRIHVVFRPVTQLFFTSARVDNRTVGWRNGVDGENGAMWNIVGGRFWRASDTATGRVYSMNPNMPATGISGEIIAGHTFPLRMHMEDAWILTEYISVEEYEAIAFRSSELTYYVEQYVAVPLLQTLRAKSVRVALPYTNMVKELMWVAQNPAAEIYNAWFLFTRDVGPVVPPQASETEKSICALPWWPDAQLLPSGSSKWQIVPGFQSAYSEPIEGATLLYNSIDRFVHEGGSYFRSIVPAQYYTKSAVINRYVYAYSFGLKRGDLAPAGVANWDKIPRKEMFLTMTGSRANSSVVPNLNVYVYMTAWNVFKVFGGRGGMLFGN